MSYDELKFDIEKLREAKAKCEETMESLTKKKEELMGKLETLRDGWNTPAGHEFFNEQDVDWAAQVDSYVKITKAVSELLDVAIVQYENVASEAKRLNI